MIPSKPQKQPTQHFPTVMGTSTSSLLLLVSSDFRASRSFGQLFRVSHSRAFQQVIDLILFGRLLLFQISVNRHALTSGFLDTLLTL
eukprot:EC851557.1.p3 GENE.EC851557.1~~EC851557.1.p3  ORF type:complete len:87 (-),score=13.38 EC851557.1:78-338(-)